METGKRVSLTVVCCLLVISAFSQNPRADGYMGIWYKYGQPYSYGYKYAGGMATFSSQHNPMAVYSPVVKKTFFVYCGTKSADVSHLQVMISYYDHRTHKVPRPVIVYDKMGVNDPQDNGSMSVDSKGFIWVFISGRGRTRPGYVFRSTEPYSIDKFDLMKQGEIVFPQAWWMNDSCFVMMYSKIQKGRELYWSLSNDGKTWTTGQKLAGMGGHFQVTNIFGNRLFSVFNYCPNGNIDKRTNLYLALTDNLGKTWKTIDGDTLSTPLTDIKSKALVHDFDSEKKLVYINDLNFDEQGNPVILAVTSLDFKPGPSGDPRELLVITRRQNSWHISRVCTVPHNYSLGSIYTGKNEWRIITPSDPGPEKYGMGGEMVLWKSNDYGLTWQKARRITQSSSFNNSYARRPFMAEDQFYAFWSGGSAAEFSESKIYFTDSKCEGVWVLPYKMTKESERPAKLKQP